MHLNNVSNILQLDGYHEEYPSATSSSQCENSRLLVLFANPHLAPDVRFDLNINERMKKKWKGNIGT